jgi:hypothetical protein
MTTFTSEPPLQMRDPCVIDWNELDVNRIVFRNENPDAKKKKIAIYYMLPGNDDIVSLYVRSPERSTPFGIVNDSKFKKSDEFWTWSVNLRYENDYEDDPFYKKMKEVDHHVLTHVVENGRVWAGRSFSYEVANELLWSPTKVSNNPEYAPTFKIRVQTFGDNANPKFDTKFFTKDPSGLTDDLVETTYVDGVPNSKIKAVFHWKELSFMPMGFGYVPYAKQIKITPNDSTQFSTPHF